MASSSSNPPCNFPQLWRLVEFFWPPENDSISFQVKRHNLYNCFDGLCEKKYTIELSFRVRDLFDLCAREMCVCSVWKLCYAHENGGIGGEIPLDFTLEQVFESFQGRQQNREHCLYLVANEGHVGIDVNMYQDYTYCSTICLTPTLRLRDLKEYMLRQHKVQNICNVVKSGPEIRVETELYPNSHTVAELNILQGQHINFLTETNADNANVRLYLVLNYCFANRKKISLPRNDIGNFIVQLETELNIDPKDRRLQLTIHTETYCLPGCPDTENKTVLDTPHLAALMNDEEIFVEQVGQAQGEGNVEVSNTRDSSDIENINVSLSRYIYTGMRVCDFKRSLLVTTNDRWTEERGIWLMQLYKVGWNEELKDNDLLPSDTPHVDAGGNTDAELPVTKFQLKFYPRTVMVFKKPYTHENNLVCPFGVDNETTSGDIIQRFSEVSTLSANNNDYKLQYNENDITELSKVVDGDLVMIVLKEPTRNTSGPSENTGPVPARREERPQQLQGSSQMTNADANI